MNSLFLKIFLRNREGFTMVEMLTGVGIFLILAGFTVPIGMRFLATQNLNSFSYIFSETLRRVRASAKMQKNDSDWGIYVDSQDYTVFKGSSYATRDGSHDEVYDIPDMVEVEEQKEIVFEKMTGLPYDAASMTFFNNYQSNVVSVSEQGRVDLNVDVSLASE